MRLQEKEIKAIAGATDTNTKTILRLLSSVKITIRSEVSTSSAGDRDILAELEENPPKVLELGFRMQEQNALSEYQKARVRDLLIEIISEYKRKCPLVVVWIGRGDFDPKSPPANVTRGVLLHACRTAGRLRAKMMRQLLP